MAITAWSEGHRFLYHWARFCAERLRALLRDRQIYCSNPALLNDPWDCKPHFNTEILSDPAERQKYAEWAVALCQRKSPMPPYAQEQMRKTLLHDPDAAAKLTNQLSAEMISSIADQYRVYCMGLDPKNLLMWSHYADSHRGICLGFSLCNEIFCTALRCEYSAAFPTLPLYDDSDEATLLALLAKSDVWRYENEYRLVVQKEATAWPDPQLLKLDGHFLKFPQGALVSIITGCQADHNQIQDLVHSVEPGVRVRRATRVPNRFEIAISQ